MATTVTLKPNAIDISGSTSGTTTLQATAVAGTTTLTLPAATDTLVGRATTDTLTNKTLTGAAMNGTVGATTPSTGAFTTLTSTGASSFATSSGDVGIGTSSPGYKLDVLGNVNRFAGASVDGIFLSTVAATDTSFYGANYFNNNGTEGVNASGRGSWRIATLTAGSPTFSIGYRAASAGAGVFSTPLTIDSSGNLGIGTTSPASRLEIKDTTNNTALTVTSSFEASLQLVNGGGSEVSVINAGGSNILSLRTANNEKARINSSGTLLVGTTAAQLDGSSKMVVLNSSATVAEFTASSGTATQAVLRSWNTATSGDNLFETFHTDAGATQRGSITYNRAGGLVMYNQTSDYRAKDITGPVTGSGALIDSVPVYMGKMKDATQERPMFIAHETPDYAHTGVKDAVDKDGNPVFQQMDASSLIPVMWAEIQSLRKRLAAAGI